MSQFASLFDQKTTDKKDTKPKVKSTVKKKAPLSSSSAASSATVKASPLPPEKTEKRTPGKSSHPDFAQVLTYLRKDTHNAVKAALIFDAEKRDLSDLVEELLAGWLKKTK